MGQTDAATDESADGVPVGVAAAQLGVTPSTLRSWGTRYGLVPSLRTAGGHRRYSAADLALLGSVQAQVRAGTAPAAAAAAVTGRDQAPGEATARRRGAGPGGRVLAVPGSDPATRGLARSAGQLDLDGAEDTILRSLRERGVVRSWDEMLRPVLVAAGRRWADTGEGIEVEHLVSEAALGALRRRRAELPRPAGGRPVLLAAAPDDQHTLTLHALALGLAEHGRPAQVLGAQVPVATLATVARRTRPPAVFVSCTVPGAVDPATLAAALPRTRPATPVVVGGAGWPTELVPALRRAPGLGEALDLLTGADQSHS